MPDLITHMAAALVLRRAFAGPRRRLVFLLGAVLPDLYFKALHVVLHADTWFCEPTHAPLVLVLECALVAMLFPAEERRGHFAALYAGSLLHVLMDAAKDNFGHGSVPALFPFSLDLWELGLYWTEDTVLVAPVALLAALALELAVLRPLLDRRPGAR
ncbi:MAG: hypothetical protein HY722_16500 [Planctomycetes bacterium]|nr:hypothetical protein [Planctomycetota bacterium]